MLPGPQARGQGGPPQFPRQPSGRSTPYTPGGSWAPAPGSLVPSVAFAAKVSARLLLGPAHAGLQCRRRRLHVMLQTGQLLALSGVLSLRFDGGVSPDAGSQLPGTLASPGTGLPPAGCRELVARFCRNALLSRSAPELLGAHFVLKTRPAGHPIYPDFGMNRASQPRSRPLASVSAAGRSVAGPSGRAGRSGRRERGSGGGCVGTFSRWAGSPVRRAVGRCLGDGSGRCAGNLDKGADLGGIVGEHAPPRNHA